MRSRSIVASELILLDLTASMVKHAIILLLVRRASLKKTGSEVSIETGTVLFNFSV